MIKTDILFIIPPFHMRNGGGSFFPLGIGYIISSVNNRKQTWEIINCSEYISSFYEEDIEKLRAILYCQISKINPTVIGIGPCVTTQLKALIVITEVCKKLYPNIPIFAGGPFASIKGQEEVFYKIIGIKYLVIGDGEKAVPELIDIVKSGESIETFTGVSFGGRRIINIVDDINTLPYPYRPMEMKGTFSERRKKKGSRQFAMIASRGCPYKCLYCVSGNMKDNSIGFRKRSKDNIIDEMLVLKNSYDANSIVFYDDLFFSNKNTINYEIYEFCDKLIEKKVNMSWQIEMRPDFFELITDDAFRLLKHAGCIQINLGIEKVSEKGLRLLGKEGNCKDLTIKMLTSKRTGIKLSATFILGGKDENEEDIVELINYAKNLPLDFAHFNPLFIYPGTPLYYDFFKNDEEWAFKVLCDELPWGEIVYENEYLKTKDLLQLIDFAYEEFYRNRSYENKKMIVDRFNLKR